MEFKASEISKHTPIFLNYCLISFKHTHIRKKTFTRKLKISLKPSISHQGSSSQDRLEMSGYEIITSQCNCSSGSFNLAYNRSERMDLLKNNTSLKKYFGVIKTKSTDHHILFSPREGKSPVNTGSGAGTLLTFG